MKMEYTTFVFSVLLIVVSFWSCEGYRRNGENDNESPGKEEDNNERKTLPWINSVEKRGACGNEIDVTIDIECRKASTRHPSESDLTRLCGLIKDGIRQYWSRSLTKDGTIWKVNVKAREVSSGSRKKVVIKMYDHVPFLGFADRSHNSGILPMTMKYLRYVESPDQSFKLIAGHEIGHSILHAAKGLEYSWTHKGSSTIWQNKYEGTEDYPISPAEIDLMKYYKDRASGIYTRSIAAEEDVVLLIGLAHTTQKDYC